MHDAKCWEKVAAGRGIWNPFQGGSCAELTLSQWAVNSSGSLSATWYRNWGMVYVEVSFRADALSCPQGTMILSGHKPSQKAAYSPIASSCLRMIVEKYGGK